jgi:hypothetical protein
MSHQKIITYFIFINGIYDILCAFSILISNSIKIPLFNNIHLNMIKNKSVELLTKKYLAYWILTYGIMRLYIYDLNIILMSYVIEAICFSNEIINKRLEFVNGLFTITLSLFIALYLFVIKSMNF